MASMGMGVAPAAGAGGAAAPAAEEEPEPEEKTHFDVELSGLKDAKAKIKVIKELRGILGLGLKEAKDMVEGAPVWIKKELKKEEADELKEKMEAVGADIKLV